LAETALLRVSLDMLMAADDQKVTLLSLLDMSAAFDCVDHLILLQRLHVAVGIAGTALDWIRSFLSGRTQQVMYGGEQSVTSAVLFGVPQGTILGPLLYVLYTAPLLSVFAKHRIDAHQYADDLQLYLSVPPAEATVAADRLGTLLVDIEVWLKTS
jgi:Reverse transcriptase (RNA-dependent DNA polymerase)